MGVSGVSYQLVPGTTKTKLFTSLVQNINNENGGLASRVCQHSIKPSYFKKLFGEEDRSRSFTIIAVDAGGVKGFCEASVHKRKGRQEVVVHLSLICTLRGYGTGLMTAFMEYCSHHILAHLVVLESVKEQVGFYRKFEFRRTPDDCRPLVGMPIPRGFGRNFQEALNGVYYPKQNYAALGGYNIRGDTVIMSRCLALNRGASTTKVNSAVNSLGRLKNVARDVTHPDNCKRKTPPPKTRVVKRRRRVRGLNAWGTGY